MCDIRFQDLLSSHDVKIFRGTSMHVSVHCVCMCAGGGGGGGDGSKLNSTAYNNPPVESPII